MIEAPIPIMPDHRLPHEISIDEQLEELLQLYKQGLLTQQQAIDQASIVALDRDKWLQFVQSILF